MGLPSPQSQVHSLRRHLYLFVFLFSLSLYLATLAPNLLPADAGEYQIVGATLGIAHPPGFALYTLLSWLTTQWLFFLSPAMAINLLSALIAALTLTLASRLVCRATGSSLAGIGAALGLAFSTTFWAQATTANVRGLAAFATAWALERLLAYRASVTAEDAGGNSPRSWRTLRLGGVMFALGLGVSHHASTLFIAGVLGLYLLWLNPRIILRLWPLLLGLVPFLAWLYFPLRGPAVGLPRLAALDGFLEHVLARGFSGDILAFATLKDLPARLLAFGNILTFEFVWPLLALAGLGAAAALYRDRPLGVTLLVAWAAHVFIAITYRAPQTVEYLLPAYVLMAVAIGFGLAEIGRLFDTLKRYGPPRVVRQTGALNVPLIVTALAVGAQFVATFPSYRTLARDNSTRAYAQSLLAAAPPKAVILSAWHWFNPLNYLQRVEGLRPDVEVRYVYPHSVTLAQSWADDILAEMAQRPVVVTSFYEPEYAALPYRFAPLGPAWEVRAQPLTTPPPDLIGAQAAGDWVFLGYHLDSSVPSISSVDLINGWQTSAPPQDINFYVHLLGPDGALYGQSDVAHRAARYVSGEVLLDRYHLDIRPDAPPGDYTLVAGAYLPDGTRLAEVPLAPLRLGPRFDPPVTLHPLFRTFGAATLIGYDVDYSLLASPRIYLHWRLGKESASVPELSLSLPAGPGYVTTPLDLTPGQTGLASLGLRTSDLNSRYVPLGNAIIVTGADIPATAHLGESLTVAVHFLAARPVVYDIAVKIEIEGAGWRTSTEGTAVGGAIPTLKWITGSRLTDRRVLTIPLNAAPGAASVRLILYDGLTQQKLAVLDPRLAPLGPGAPLDSINIVH